MYFLILLLKFNYLFCVSNIFCKSAGLKPSKYKSSLVSSTFIIFFDISLLHKELGLREYLVRRYISFQTSYDIYLSISFEEGLFFHPLVMLQ